MEDFKQYIMMKHDYIIGELQIDEEKKAVIDLNGDMFTFDREMSEVLKKVVMLLPHFDPVYVRVYKKRSKKEVFYKTNIEILYRKKLKFRMEYTLQHNKDTHHNEFKLWILSKNFLATKDFAYHFEPDFLFNVQKLTKKTLHYYQHLPELRLKWLVNNCETWLNQSVQEILNYKGKSAFE